ncbi:BMP family ABC transporter substrate-binding protein [bacterium 0.1xD8-71]|nr:BMP family ABC transporter substrate-binding protein [bacterium 0.1xD8-71]
MEGTNPEPIIGLIGSMEHPIITDWIVGYVEGARSVEPDIKVIVSYVGSWDDSAKGKELALAQYNQGADIIITPAETAALGCVEAAKESGKYIIGIDVDQSMAFKGIDEDAANKDVDFSVREGEIHALMGEPDSGSGGQSGIEKQRLLKP